MHKPALVLLLALMLPVSAAANGRHDHNHHPQPPPVVENVPETSDSSNHHGLWIGLIVTCIVIEVASDGTCLFWRWNIWKPAGQPASASSVPEIPPSYEVETRATRAKP